MEKQRIKRTAFFAVAFLTVAALLFSAGVLPSQAGADLQTTGTPSASISPTGGTPVAEQGSLRFEESDKALCQVTAQPVQGVVDVTLPAGQTAVLQASYYIVHPDDLTSPIQYREIQVANGDRVQISDIWPGIRSSDSVVEVHFGAILFDPVSKNPISNRGSLDYYWYPWFCNVAATPDVPNTGFNGQVPAPEVTILGAATEAPTGTGVVPPETTTPLPTEAATNTAAPVNTAVPPETAVPTEMPTEVSTALPSSTATVVPGGTSIPNTGGASVLFMEQSAPLCQKTPKTLRVQVKVNLPAGVTAGNSALLRSTFDVIEPFRVQTKTQAHFVTVRDGQMITLSGKWPGVQNKAPGVEVRFGAGLLDPSTRQPISALSSISYFWFPWTCAFLQSNQPGSQPTPGATSTVQPSGTAGIPNTGATGTVEITPTGVGTGTAAATEAATTSPTEMETAQPSGTAVATGLPTGAAEVTSMPTGTAEGTGIPTGTAEGTSLPTGTAGGTATPTAGPTEVANPTVLFENGDEALCQVDAGVKTAIVDVSLPAGQSAILQGAFDVAEPASKATQIQYVDVTVHDGDRVEITGFWPGASRDDSVVEIHFGAQLLDPATRSPISDSISKDYYWYSWICPVTSPSATGTPVTTGTPVATGTPGTPGPTGTPGATGTPGIPETGSAFPGVSIRVLPQSSQASETPVPATPEATPVATGQAGQPSVGSRARKGPAIGFVETSAPYCQAASGALTGTVQVQLQRGQTAAVLRTGARVVAPSGMATDYTFADTVVRNGDRVTINATWPGFTSGENLSAVHFFAVLLDARKLHTFTRPVGLDYFAYAGVCPNLSPATTAVPGATPGSVSSLPVTGGASSSSSLAAIWSDFWNSITSLFSKR